MSLILDALRKSEQERRQAGGSGVAPIDPQAVAVPRRRGGALVLTAAAALGLAAFAGYWLSGEMPAPTDAVQAATGVKQAARNGASGTASVSSPRAPQFTTSPFAATASQTVRDLAKETRVPQPEPKSTVARPAPKREVTTSPSSTIPVAPGGSAVKFLRSMPLEFRRSLPELVVNIHIYAPRASERILYINNRQYRAGERVRDDIVVEEIVEDGAVLSYRGERFKLPRPS